jgi:hypothetical protein
MSSQTTVQGQLIGVVYTGNTTAAADELQCVGILYISDFVNFPNSALISGIKQKVPLISESIWSASKRSKETLW